LDKSFYAKFLRLIQEKAKTYDFFDKKTAKRKYRVYKIIDKVITVIASVSSGLCTLVMGIEDFDDQGGVLAIVEVQFV
jgi:hypothetical protein